MKNRYRIARTIAVAILVLLGGCREKGFDPEKVVCSLSVGSETIGGGVLLGEIDRNGNTNIALITARHVVTENWQNADNVDIVYRQADTNGTRCVRRLAGAWDRWRTLARKDVDCAWIILKEKEFAHGIEWEWVGVEYNQNQLAKKRNIEEDYQAVVANAFGWHETTFAPPDMITPGHYSGLMFPNNRTLRAGVPMWLGAVREETIKNESGSGVFAVDKNKGHAYLVGVTTASAPGLTGFVEMTNVFECISRTVRGDGSNVPFLAHRHELW